MGAKCLRMLDSGIMHQALSFKPYFHNNSVSALDPDSRGVRLPKKLLWRLHKAMLHLTDTLNIVCTARLVLMNEPRFAVQTSWQGQWNALLLLDYCITRALWLCPHPGPSIQAAVDHSRDWFFVEGSETLLINLKNHPLPSTAHQMFTPGIAPGATATKASTFIVRYVHQVRMPRKNFLLQGRLLIEQDCLNLVWFVWKI